MEPNDNMDKLEDVHADTVAAQSALQTGQSAAAEQAAGSSGPESNEFEYEYPEDDPLQYKRPKNKKRANPVSSSVFSLRRRAEEDAEASAEASGASGNEKTYTNEPYSAKRQVTTQTETTPEWTKLKKPKRRTTVEEQARRNEELRRKQEEAADKEIEQLQVLANADRVITSHYNQRAYASRKEDRNSSVIFKLRNFNNVIKLMLITKYSKPGDRVLDIACGKGGDLFKWQKARIQQYVGLDISQASITEAIKRYRGIRYKNFEAFFLVSDAFGEKTDILAEVASTFPQQVEFPLDVVSIQFALHYAFENEAKIRNLLQNISRSLKRGGMFIGTIPSSDYIRHRVKHLPAGERKWGNSVYNVEFLKDLPANGIFNPPFGNAYIFYLKDAIDSVPEFVVPFETLRSLAQSYGLELRYKKSLFELFVEEIPTFYKQLGKKALEGLKRSDGKLGLQGEEKEAAEFYLTFAFEKVH